MKYIIRTKDGEEHGPLDQDVILQWVKNGRVTAGTDVRNALMKSWTTAGKLPFYKEYVENAAGERGEADPSQSGKPKDIGPKEAIYSLNQAGMTKFAPARPIQRMLAGLFDILLTGGVSIAFVYLLMTNRDRLDDDILRIGFLLISIGSVFWFSCYYTIGLGMKAQTFGQWFWGVMIIRPDGSPVFPGRAFIYSLLYPLLVFTSPLFYIIMPGRRTLQELLSGTRIIRIKRTK